MFLTVNGSEREVADDATVQALVDSLGAPADGRGVAVAVDTEVVPRSAWAETGLVSGSRVEILIAVQGG